MAAKKNTYHSTRAIPKKALDNILHYLMVQQIKKTKQDSYFSAQPKHPHFLFQNYKNFRLTKRLRDTALSLLKTQFSKFPVDHGADNQS